jgi:predicted DNA-binding transcriptional regulator AlpA
MRCKGLHRTEPIHTEYVGWYVGAKWPSSRLFSNICVDRAFFQAANWCVRPQNEAFRRPRAMQTDTALWRALEVARYLRLPVSAVYDLAGETAAPRLPHVVLAGQMRFRKEDIDRWLDLLVSRMAASAAPREIPAPEKAKMPAPSIPRPPARKERRLPPSRAPQGRAERCQPMPAPERPERVGNYRVRVRYGAPADGEHDAPGKAVAGVIARSILRSRAAKP